MLFRVQLMLLLTGSIFGIKVQAEFSDPFEALEYLDKVDPPRPDSEVQEIIKAAWSYHAGPQSAAVAILLQAEYLRNKTYGRTEIRKAAFCLAKESPGTAISYYPKFENEKYAFEVLRQAISADILTVLGNDSLILHVPGARNLIEKAIAIEAKKRPEDFLSKEESLLKYRDGAQILEAAAKASLEKNPAGFLCFAEKHPDHPLVTAANIKKTAYAAVGRSPWSNNIVLAMTGLYQNEPYRKDVVEKALRWKLAFHPGSVIHWGEAFRDEDYAQKLLEDVVDSCDGAIFGGAHYIKDRPYALEVLTKAAQLAPWQAIEKLDSYADMPFAKKILTIAVAKSPVSALSNRDNILKLPYGRDLVSSAENHLFASKMLEDRCFIFEHGAYFRDQKRVEKAMTSFKSDTCLALIRQRDD